LQGVKLPRILGLHCLSLRLEIGRQIIANHAFAELNEAFLESSICTSVMDAFQLGALNRHDHLVEFSIIFRLSFDITVFRRFVVGPPAE